MQKNSDSYTTSKAQNHEWPKTVPYRTEREPEWRARDWAYRYSPSHPKSPSSTSRSSIYGTVQTSPFSVTAHDLNQLHKHTHTHTLIMKDEKKNWNWKLKIENENRKWVKDVNDLKEEIRNWTRFERLQMVLVVLVLSLWFFFFFVSFVRLVFEETLSGEIWGFLYPSFCSLGVYIDATDLEIYEMTHLPFRSFFFCVKKYYRFFFIGKNVIVIRFLCGRYDSYLPQRKRITKIFLGQDWNGKARP